MKLRRLRWAVWGAASLGGRVMVLIGGDRFIEHRPPEGHPEQPGRARVMQAVSRRWVDRGGAPSGRTSSKVEAAFHGLSWFVAL